MIAGSIERAGSVSARAGRLASKDEACWHCCSGVHAPSPGADASGSFISIAGTGYNAGRMDSSKRRLAAFLEEYRTKPLDEVAVSPHAGGGRGAAGGGGRFGFRARQYAAAGPPSPQRGEYLRLYRRWLRPFTGTLVIIFILAVIGDGLSMLPPLGLKFVVDKVLLAEAVSTAERLRLLNLAGLVMGGLILLSELIKVARSYRTSVANAKLTRNLRQVLFDRLLRLPLDHLHDLKSGGAVARLSGDVDQTAGLVHTAIISPGVAGLRFVMALGFLFYLSWELALTCVIVVPGIVALNAWWLRRLRPIYRSAGQDHQAANARATETFGGIRIVRAFGRESREQRDFFLSRHSELRKSILARMNQLGIQAIWETMMPGVALLILWLGGYLILRGQKITVGSLFAYQWYASLILHPVWVMVNSLSETQRALAAMERVFEIVQRPIEMPDRPDARLAPRDIQEIRFENVSFAYPQGQPVLHEVNLTTAGGKVIALVGPSGAGKTTLVNLVARFHDPTAGRILLNGVDLRDLRLRSFRRLLGVVEQEVFLFDGTVRENIAYGRRGASEAEIITAAEQANADSFIRQFPNGYDTVIGERGVKLSGGQRQRLSIARAILADPAILILDEATSNLDSESEQLIQQALEQLLANRTTFVIAHRLSTVTHADQIIVLEQGRVVEQGRHTELLARGGRYHAMVQRQRDSLEELDTALRWE